MTRKMPTVSVMVVVLGMTTSIKATMIETETVMKETGSDRVCIPVMTTKKRRITTTFKVTLSPIGIATRIGTMTVRNQTGTTATATASFSTGITPARPATASTDKAADDRPVTITTITNKTAAAAAGMKATAGVDLHPWIA